MLFVLLESDALVKIFNTILLHSEEIMEEKIQNLCMKIRDIGALYLIYQRRDNIEQIKKMIPEIQEFVLWFMEKNILEIDVELYQRMCQNLIIILEDILQAMICEDSVLLHDATAYGLMEYLQLFVDIE